MATKAAPDDEGLKRLGGGRWQTRDGRFSIEPQSGTWSVVDAEETDDLGLPLVRGPFRRLTEAKAAIAAARTSAAPTSPLAARLDQPRAAGRRAAALPAKAGDDDARHIGKPAEEPAPAGKRDRERAADKASKQRSASPVRSPKPAEPETPEEPSWFKELEPGDRGRARRMIERLTEQGVRDATSIVRRDLAGGVPAIAATAIERELAALPEDASVGAVVQLLADGK